MIGTDQVNLMEKPIDLLLFCPRCYLQHVDAPKDDWTNPPHRTHLCHGCRYQWRPADIATNGVRAIDSCGKNDQDPSPYRAKTQPLVYRKAKP